MLIRVPISLSIARYYHVASKAAYYDIMRLPGRVVSPSNQLVLLILTITHQEKA
mgnify:FL=1